MVINMGEVWHYDAFISYRHMELDSFVAKNLHKQLENFKLPVNVARRLSKNDKEGVKTRITRVFRDQEELPLVSNLADPIVTALEQSEYLIVICSPRLKESMWCKKEIETFIGLRDREHVLLVLIEGEPADSFPEELLYKEIEETKNDGSVIKTKVPVEPLAADVRGDSQTKIRRKIKTEMLRLAAPMFGCGYDDLRQRHREQKMRRIITASLAGSAVCFLFGSVSTAMALKIRRQNIRITAQSEEISLQAAKIEEQYQEALRSNSISQAGAALDLLEKGDRIGAIETALEAFPGGENADIPYTAEAAFALSESLNLYKDGKKIIPDRLIEADTTIDFMKVSPEGGRLLTLDDFGMLCVWDGGSGAKLASLLLGGSLNRKEEQIVFLNEDMFLYPSDEGISCYDIDAAEENVYKVECDDVYGMAYCKENDTVVICTDEDFLAVMGENGETLFKGSWQGASIDEKGLKTTKEPVMSEDGSLFAAAVSSETEARILVYETKTGSLYRSYKIPGGNVKFLKFEKNVLYVIDNEKLYTQDMPLRTDNLRGGLYACDLSEDDAFLWTYRNESGWLYEISISSKEGSNCMLCASYDTAVVLDKEDGSYIDSFFFGSGIVKMRSYIGRDAFLVFTRDGTWHYANVEIMTDMVGTIFTDCTSNNVKMFAIGDEYYATLPYSGKKVTLYRSALGSNFETLCETGESCAYSALNSDGALLAIAGYGDEYACFAEVLDTDTGETLWRFESENYCQKIGFYPEKGAVILVTNKGIYLFDEKTGEQLEFYEMDGISGDYLCADDSGRYVFFKSYRSLYGCDLADGSVIYDISQDEVFADGNAAAVCPFMKYCAVASKSDNSVRLYSLEDLQDGKTDCLDELTNINAAYVSSLFFGDAKSQMLYVVYKNGDISAYTVNLSDGKFDDNAVMRYQDMKASMNGYIHPEGADFSVLTGQFISYLIYDAYAALEEGRDEGLDAPDLDNHGKPAAYINGFLAADAKKGCVYLSDGQYIYRAPIYDVEALRKEAEKQLGR